MMIETRDALVAMKQRNHALEREKEELATKVRVTRKGHRRAEIRDQNCQGGREEVDRSACNMRDRRTKVQEGGAARGEHFRSKK